MIVFLFAIIWLFHDYFPFCLNGGGKFIGTQGLLSKYSFEIVISNMVQHFDEVTFHPWRSSFKIRRLLWVSLSPGFKIVMWRDRTKLCEKSAGAGEIEGHFFPAAPLFPRSRASHFPLTSFPRRLHYLTSWHRLPTDHVRAVFLFSYFQQLVLRMTPIKRNSPPILRKLAYIMVHLASNLSSFQAFSKPWSLIRRNVLIAKAWTLSCRSSFSTAQDLRS